MQKKWSKSFNMLQPTSYPSTNIALCTFCSWMWSSPSCNSKGGKQVSAIYTTSINDFLGEIFQGKKGTPSSQETASSEILKHGDSVMICSFFSWWPFEAQLQRGVFVFGGQNVAVGKTGGKVWHSCRPQSSRRSYPFPPGQKRIVSRSSFAENLGSFLGNEVPAKLKISSLRKGGLPFNPTRKCLGLRNAWNSR